jgi:hypothetical protein
LLIILLGLPQKLLQSRSICGRTSNDRAKAIEERFGSLSVECPNQFWRNSVEVLCVDGGELEMPGHEGLQENPAE